MSEPGPRLTTARLVLAPARAADAAAIADYQLRNADFHAPWNPPRPDGFFTTPFWEERIGYFEAEERLGMSLRFLLRAGDRVVGVANFTSVIRGCSLNCWLGYGLDQACEGQGFMYEALSAAIPHVFGSLGLHLVQAGHVPENLRSSALLRRLGFSPFGYARDYVYIAGAWRDHVLQGLINPSPLTP